MTLKAAFIGINRYLDSNVNDLSCARRDALALHALFVDSVPGLNASLMLDDFATFASVKAAIDGVLTNADPADEVMLFFAGHGSPDHQLIVHDSRATDPNTMISMSELATSFRTSPAKSVFCILDCCFSGEAPARVLDPAPIARAGAPNLNQMFAGEGRFLIAASSPTQSAWEQSGKGHGILTKAIIDVLMDAAEPQIGIGDALDKIMARVQASAARMGRTQTPVHVGMIEGGLRLPRLVAGECYAREFPDRVGIKISKQIRELTQLQLPDRVVALWETRFTSGLNDLQLSAVNDFRVLDGENLLVVAPTGAGKTFIGELAALRQISEGKRAVFLLPYRALVNEKYEEFTSLYGERLSLRVIRCTGDYLDETSSFVKGKYDVAVLTYEMFLSLTLLRQSSLNHFGVVVLDEAQFITDPNRGIVVELLLTLLRTARDQGVEPQIVALSAVIGGVNGLDQWLGAKLLLTKTRPVALTEGVIDRSGLFQFRDLDGSVQTQQFVPAGSIIQRRDESSAQDVIVPLVKKLIADDETVIVFRNQRGPAEGCANYLGNELGLARAQKALDMLSTHDQSTTGALLRRCLERGVAFHNSNLTREERVVVERAFRTGDEVRVMAATTTLAAGINTPASTVILAEQDFVGEDGRPFTIAEYKNMAGRAGRPGFSRPGRAMIYAETGLDRQRLFTRYVLGDPESVRSSFEPSEFETWILRLLSQVKAVPKEGVAKLLANTYAGYSAILADPSWQEATKAKLSGLLDEMVSLEMLEEERGVVRLSLLGRACGQSSLSFKSCLRLVALLKRHGTNVSARNLMLLIQALPEVDATYTPLMPRAGVEKSRARQLAQNVGDAIPRELQRHADDDKSYLKRCKRCLVILDWTEGLAVNEIERRYSASPFAGKIGLGNIRAFADATRFHLRAAADIARIMFVAGGPPEQETEALLRSLEIGVPLDQLGLLQMAVGWTRGELLALRAAGIKTSDQLWRRSQQQLVSVLGEARGRRVDAARPPAKLSGRA